MVLRIVLPKGRIYDKVCEILSECGLNFSAIDRNYRPLVSKENIEIKLLKCQNIPPLVELGHHDIGFAGLDWIKEQNSNVVNLLDLGFDPVKIIAAIPENSQIEQLKNRPIVVVSEYENLTKKYLNQNGYQFKFIRSYGATEVFPPEDADLIVDNTATGATLKANHLKIVSTILESTTQFIANKQAMNDPTKKIQIENILSIMQGVIQAKNRVLLEMNCEEINLNQIVSILPSMRSVTVSKLFKSNWYSVKSAVLLKDVPDLIVKLNIAGAKDILEIPIRKVM